MRTQVHSKTSFSIRCLLSLVFYSSCSQRNQGAVRSRNPCRCLRTKCRTGHQDTGRPCSVGGKAALAMPSGHILWEEGLASSLGSQWKTGNGYKLPLQFLVEQGLRAVAFHLSGTTSHWGSKEPQVPHTWELFVIHSANPTLDNWPSGWEVAPSHSLMSASPDFS